MFVEIEAIFENTSIGGPDGLVLQSLAKLLSLNAQKQKTLKLYSESQYLGRGPLLNPYQYDFSLCKSFSLLS